MGVRCNRRLARRVQGPTPGSADLARARRGRAGLIRAHYNQLIRCNHPRRAIRAPRRSRRISPPASYKIGGRIRQVLRQYQILLHNNPMEGMTEL